MTEIVELAPSRQIPAGGAQTGASSSAGWSWTPWALALALTPLVVVPVVSAGATWDRPPWLLMWVISSALWLGLKWGTVVDAWRMGLRPSFRRFLGYMFVWPNTDALT